MVEMTWLEMNGINHILNCGLSLKERNLLSRMNRYDLTWTEAVEEEYEKKSYRRSSFISELEESLNQARTDTERMSNPANRKKI